MKKYLFFLFLTSSLIADELPLPFCYTKHSENQRNKTAFFLFETKETSHYLGHFFHLLEHIVGLWSFYGDAHFQDVDLIVLSGDRQTDLPLAWEGPNKINRHLLKALFPQAEVKTWETFVANPLIFAQSVTSDRALSFNSPECLHLNKMLGAARHFLSKEALQHLADRIHAYAGTKFQEKNSLHITYIKRPPPRALDPNVEQNLFFAIQQLENVSLRIEDFALLSFQKQIEIVGNTDILIGVHGNGLSHLLFLPPQAKIIEIFPPSAHALDYRLFADARHLSYTGILADRGVISSEEAYRIGPFGDINHPIHELDLLLILKEICP